MSKLVTGARACSVLYNFLECFPSESNKKWVLPVNVCEVVPLTFCTANTPFLYADINPENLFIDFSKVSLEDLAGILIVAPYGAEVNNSILMELDYLKEKHPELLIILDLCLSVPDFEIEYNANIDLVLYSTGYSKPVDIGYGGFGITKHEIKSESKPTGVEGLWQRKEKQYLETQAIHSDGRNVKGDWLDSSLNQIDKDSYKEEIRKTQSLYAGSRAEIASIYRENIDPKYQLHSSYQSWRFNILVPEKDKLLKAIEAEGLFASGHYSVLSGSSSFENAEVLSNHILNLFFDKYFTVEKAKAICGVINNHYHRFQNEESFILCLNRFNAVRAKIGQ